MPTAKASAEPPYPRDPGRFILAADHWEVNHEYDPPAAPVAAAGAATGGADPGTGTNPAPSSSGTGTGSQP